MTRSLCRFSRAVRRNVPAIRGDLLCRLSTAGGRQRPRIALARGLCQAETLGSHIDVPCARYHCLGGFTCMIFFHDRVCVTVRVRACV